MCFNCFELYVMKIYYGTKHLNHYLNYPFNWNTIDQILLNYRCCWSKTAKKWLAIVQALVNWDTTFLLVILIWWTRLNWNYSWWLWRCLICIKWEVHCWASTCTMKIQATDNLRSYDFIKEIKALGNLCAYNQRHWNVKQFK